MDYEKKYKEANDKVAARFGTNVAKEIFTDLYESEDEKIVDAIRKALESKIEDLGNGVTKTACLAWLGKQANHANFCNKIQVGDKVTRNRDGVLVNLSQLNRVAKKDEKQGDANKEYWRGYREGKQEILDKYAELEKQGEEEQLYIRFGEIPTDEKSKIYRGEIEVGTENGVSVYPAFKTNEGDIVLGLNLPITKTTLYTQQHLIEYDDRPCYLVKGDYVGKDTDGQTLINNVSIIEKIDTYRLKEKKQGEQKPTDKEGPKFKDGNWIVYRNGVWQICNIGLKTYYELLKTNNEVSTRSIEEVDANSHLWTIDDAKDGDVLVYHNTATEIIMLFKSWVVDRAAAYTHFHIFDNNCRVNNSCDCGNGAHPATKEQRDLLFQKIKEAGYEWDSEKKELKKVDVELTDFEKSLKHIMIETLECGDTHNLKADAEMLLRFAQKPAEWSEEDEENRDLVNKILWESVGKHLDVPEYGSVITQGDAASLTQWLKALKERIVG